MARVTWAEEQATRVERERLAHEAAQDAAEARRRKQAEADRARTERSKALLIASDAAKRSTFAQAIAPELQRYIALEREAREVAATLEAKLAVQHRAVRDATKLARANQVPVTAKEIHMREVEALVHVALHRARPKGAALVSSWFGGTPPHHEPERFDAWARAQASLSEIGL